MSLVPAQQFSHDLVNAKINYAQQLSTARLLPRDYQNNPGNLLLAVEYGESIGIHPLTAINGLHIMNGKPTASAGLISSLVRRAGHKLRISEGDGWATATIIRSDDPDFEFTVTWTMDMARQAGLMSNNTWKSYPQAMLKARAITQVARDACQEALNGVQYTPEELGAQVELDEAGEQVVVQQVTRVQAATVPPSAPEIPAGMATLTQAKRFCLNQVDGDKLRAASLWAASGFPEDGDALLSVDEVRETITALIAQANDEPVDAEVVEDPETTSPVSANPAENVDPWATAVPAAVTDAPF